MGLFVLLQISIRTLLAKKMAVGKNKRLSKGKKGNKKKIVDPFSKKDWYDVKAPANFSVRNVGKTPVMRTQGTKISTDGLKGRVFEIAQADLNNDEVSFRKFKLICEDVQGKNVMTNFHGMGITTDHLRSLVKKWQTCIEAFADVKTTDGYLLRVFVIGFTHRRPNMVKKTAYAKSSQVRAMRKKMIEIIHREVSTKELKELVSKLLPDSISSDITKECSNIYPLHNVLIRKVKCLKKPKYDVQKLMDAHGDAGTTVVVEEGGVVVERDSGFEPPVLDAV